MQKITRDRIGYLFDRRLEPVLRVQPGETIVVETEDSRTGRSRTPEQVTPEALRRLKAGTYYGNPVTGPIYVEGAEPGDTLVVDVRAIEPDTQGYTGYDPNSNHFPEWLGDYRTDIFPIRDGFVHFHHNVRIPVKPMIGTIGTAPEAEALLSGTVGKHGGNLDCPDIAPGNRAEFRVHVPGAQLFLGDVHAAQGDGEFSGGAIEMRSTVTITVDLRKGHPPAMTWPRVITPESLIVVAADRPLESALKLALRDMVLWMEEEYGFERGAAYMLLSQVGSGRACQAMASTLVPYTMAVHLPRALLP